MNGYNIPHRAYLSAIYRLLGASSFTRNRPLEHPEEALALPSEARALLADRLVESLDVAEASRIDKLWATTAKRRSDEVRQGLVQTIPGDEALARVRPSLAGDMISPGGVRRIQPTSRTIDYRL